MNMLAFETAADPGSVALFASGQKSILYSPLPQASHFGMNSQTMLPLAQALLEKADLRFCDIDAIAFGQGPGSFTGLRIACGLAQGLAFGRQLPILGITTLAGMALCAAEKAHTSRVLSVLDARMNEVYFGFFEEGLLQGALGLASPHDLPIPKEGNWVIAGNALLAYPCLQGRAAHLAQYPEIAPSAMGVLNLAIPRFLKGERGGFHEAHPLYVRDNIAKTTLERAAEKAGRLA